MQYNASITNAPPSVCPPAPGTTDVNLQNMSHPLLPSLPMMNTLPPPPTMPPTRTLYQGHIIPNSGTFATPQLFSTPPPNCPIPPQYPMTQMPPMQYPPQMMPPQHITAYPAPNMNTPSMVSMWPPNYPYPYTTPTTDPKCFNTIDNNSKNQFEYPSSSYTSSVTYASWNTRNSAYTTDGRGPDRPNSDSGVTDRYPDSAHSKRSQRSPDSKKDYDRRNGYRSRSPSCTSVSSYHSRSSVSHRSRDYDDKYNRSRRNDEHYDSRSERRRDSSLSSRRSSRRSSRSPTYRRSRSRSRSRSSVISRYRSERSESVASKIERESPGSSPTHRKSRRDSHIPTERESLVERWRMNNCSSMQEMTKKLEELSEMNPEQIIEHERKVWTRSAPSNLFYKRDPGNAGLMSATPKLLALCERFEKELVKRSEEATCGLPPYIPPPRKTKFRLCKHKTELCSSSSDESSSDEEDRAMEELDRKKQHPQRLHPELWHNDFGEMNDGPLCRCSHKARKSGIRHNVYSGEQHLNKCNIDTNNAEKLHHYRITVSPPVNFLTKTPTIIHHDSHEYIFEGFSMFSHFPLKELPTCKVIRFNIEYTILYIDETPSENFTVRELDLFYDYLFKEVLELVDLDLRASGDKGGCNQFHFMPRFVRDLPENGKEILSMNEVLNYLLESSKPLISTELLPNIEKMSQYEWQVFADEVKCMVVTYPGKKPCSLRVDQLDREQNNLDPNAHPEIVHFGIRPPQLSYAGNPEFERSKPKSWQAARGCSLKESQPLKATWEALIEKAVLDGGKRPYQKAWRDYVKFRHLLANMPKPSQEDKRKLANKETRLQEMRTLSKMKRDVTIALTSEGFYRTGIMCDIIQHAMLLPVLVCHLRFHRSLDVLEEDMGYKFNNRYLLQLALTHPSYRENFGTNPDHARNSLTNCGIRQPEYGDRRIHYMNTRKRGINTLIQIMSRFGKKTATESNIGHNERLEFLGDAVVEFITSIHLFHLFPDLEEGGLATYRAAIVQNQHLAILAQKLELDAYMLYAHGSDLCHDLELRHAMANCFEALMGALFLDGGIEVADKVFGETLFKQDPDLIDIWANYPLHPLQEQEPDTDRQWIPQFTTLQKLTEFEERIGIEFQHIRLLARAFTDRSVGYTNLTLGSNQRLEFLGDTVLQIIASEYLYKFFPEHHEGHLSLLRSSLVNNRTQAVVCDDLGMTQYAIYSNPKADIKTKDRADLLEAFLGALYVDQGLKHCHVFCEVCFFPRLQDFIMNQDWNDPKSKLQQCCLTLRTMDGGEPDIPVYKVIECMGPTNTRVYTVAVYFRGERLAQASGHSIQQAEMNAAKEAISMSKELFPQLDHQKRVIAKSMKKQRRWPGGRGDNLNEPVSSNRSSRSSMSTEGTYSCSSRARSPDRFSDRDRKRDRDRFEDVYAAADKRRERDSYKERDRDRDINKDRDRDRDSIKDRDRDRDSIKDRDRDRDSNKDRDRDSNKDRDRDSNKDRERDRDSNKDRDRDRDSNKDRDRDRERDRVRSPSKKRENDRRPSSYRDDKSNMSK